MRLVPLLLLLAAPAAAQDGWVSSWIPHLRLEPGPVTGSSGAGIWAPAPWAPHEAPSAGPHAALGPAAAEAVAALLRPESPTLRRDELEGPSDGTQRFHDLPGGIVFGRRARLLEPLGTARLGIDARGRLVLRTAAGRALELPAATPGLLIPCLDFATSPRGSDVAISIAGTIKLELAPEFAGSEVAGTLEQADRAPHARLPGWRATKSVIVDRDVRLEPAGDGVALAADLELRFYEPDDSLLVRGLSRRVATFVLADGPGGLRLVGDAPATAAVVALARDLDGAAELARWVGLFRWAAAADPAGLARIRTELARRRGRGPERTWASARSYGD